MTRILVIGFFIALTVFLLNKPSEKLIFIREAEATTTPSIVVQVEVVYTKELIIQEIHKTFPEIPLMVKVAECESNFKLDAKGPTNDQGLFQINYPSWNKKAKELGYPDYQVSLEDNLKMARYIYDHQGISAWNSSRRCWGK